jgi:hypothetical protein
LHPPFDYNPTTKLWGCLASNAIMGQKILKYSRLVKLAIVIVLSNVEDEETFSIANFMTYKFHNHLIIDLNLVVKMHAQEFYKLETFL